ncbi:hypothetical protein THRCLA_03274 [Thraustotheca clavata]|uniref:FDX-ACB domain-containing protein n=1 Tax=Thraustotheca clavata TaxID=74557 RepID=A0A1W0A2L8_9STRA|nr:hypothetical protein THRCLA_03274 [Thraustotheca clavata]
MTIGDLTNLGLVNSDSSKSFSVLIVGDGNFSYTCALARQLHALRHERKLPSIRTIATSLDTADELTKMYPGSVEKLAEIRQHNIQVLHNFNATRIESYLDKLGNTNFDRIVFNFPHYAEGGNKRNKIHKHRQLLTQFFKSSVNALAPHGQVWVTLCAGQGGTQAETIVRAFGDTWQVAQCAASANYLLYNVHEAPVDALYQLGYNSVGHRLQEKAFRNQAGLTHVFCRDSIGEVACFPLTWSRDISFWVNAGFNESKFLPVLEKAFGPQVSIEIEKIDEYVSDQGRLAYGYRLSLSSSTMALSKEYVNAKCDEVVEFLDKHIWNDVQA